MGIKFTAHTTIFKKSKEFLHHNQNKADLFLLLVKDLIIIPPATARIVCTVNNDVLSYDPFLSAEFISRWDQEEADTRIVLHVKHHSDEGHKVVCIQSVETNVVVIVTTSFFELNIQDLWFEYGTRKYKKILPIHAFANNLTKEKCNGLLFCYAFTGCDTVSSFATKGKSAAWNTWNSYEESTATFIRLSQTPTTLQPQDLEGIERFVVLSDVRSSSVLSVNEARRWLFTKKGKTVETIPPSQNALVQHILRVVYQTGFVGKTSLEKQQNLLDVKEWGWKCNEYSHGYEPLWIQSPKYQNL